MPEGKGYGKKKKKLPAWTKQKAGSVAVPKGSKPIGSKPALSGSGSVHKPKKKKVEKKAKLKKAANVESSRKLLRGILGMSR